MRDTDLSEFSQMLDAVCGMLSRGSYTPSPKNTAMWFRSLAAYDITAVRGGFDGHVKDPQRGRFVPVPADIIAQIDGLAAEDGRPGCEEAWATSVRAADESSTVVWTEEMARAWAIAQPVHSGGDEVGARMAFKETYTRLVDESRRDRRKPAWQASLGFDASLRDAAIDLAARAGRLPAPERLAIAAPIESLEALAGAATAPPAIRERLLKLREALVASQSGPTAAEIDRQRTDELKATAAERAAAFQGGAA